MIGAAIGLAGGLVGAIGKMFGRGKANRQMDKLLREDPQYSANPLAAERLQLARTLLNSRMPGAASAERNILTGQAGQIGNINRNATDASQAIAAAAGVGADTNNAFEGLANQEAMDFQRRQGNLSNAQEGMIQEGDKVFNDQVRRFDNKVAVRGAQNQNRQANWGDVSNLGFGLMDFGMSGGFDKMFGGSGGGSMNSANVFGGPQAGSFSSFRIPSSTTQGLPTRNPFG
jgi:hypothetical protein